MEAYTIVPNTEPLPYHLRPKKYNGQEDKRSSSFHLLLFFTIPYTFLKRNEWDLGGHEYIEENTVTCMYFCYPDPCKDFPLIKCLS